MAYRVDIDRKTCFNCGICMDICPVGTLDMTRPEGRGFEGGSPKNWMMEKPVQVETCIGCQLCALECPVSAIEIASRVEEVAMAPHQGPIRTAPEVDEKTWIPLSALTVESGKAVRTDPWGSSWRYETAVRPLVWKSWRSWIAPGRRILRAPCQEACPVETNAGLYVGLIAEGRFDEALAVAGEPNPFPSVCGRVCRAPCQDVCRRGELDEPIAIRTLKRFAAEYGRRAEKAPMQSPKRERVAVVGAGPAGLSAADYLARWGYRVTVFEAMPVAGGMMAIGIPEYRLPKEVLNKEIQTIVDRGVQLKVNTTMGRDFSLYDLEKEGYKAVFVATGAMKSRRLGVPGEDLPGVQPATVFLRDVNLGKLVKMPRRVVVVGGGSTAMDAARSAWRAGAEEVHVLYRRTREDMPAQAEEVSLAEYEGIHLQCLVNPVAVSGTDGRVSSVRCVRMGVLGSDEGGRSEVAPLDGTDFDIDADAMLIAIGEEPDPSVLPHGAGIEVSRWAGIVANPETLATSRVGVFAGGDVVMGPANVIEAIAQGKKAAKSIDGFLRKVASRRLGFSELDRRYYGEARSVDLDLSVRGRPEMPLAKVRPGSYEEVELGYGIEDAVKEARRCLRCDAAGVCPSTKVTARRAIQVASKMVTEVKEK